MTPTIEQAMDDRTLLESAAKAIATTPAIPIRAKRDLIAAGISTVQQANKLSDAELLKIPSVGRVAIKAIRAAAAMGGE
jgi:hypothetical protein